MTGEEDIDVYLQIRSDEVFCTFFIFTHLCSQSPSPILQHDTMPIMSPIYDATQCKYKEKRLRIYFSFP